MNISIDLLKQLRKETLAGIADCRKALEDANGDYEKAKKLIVERGLEKAAKKEGKETAVGIVESYVHSNNKVGVLVELHSETDFVARNEEFKKLAHELALQIAAMNPKTVDELLKSPNIRDPKIVMNDLVKQTIAKVGENITVAKFSRLEVGEEE